MVEHSEKRHPEVARLRAATRMAGDPELEKSWPEAYASIVEVTTGDGRTLSRRVDYARGTMQDPLTPDEFLGKYLKLATTVATAPHMQRIADLVTRIERAMSVRDLADLLRNPRRSRKG